MSSSTTLLDLISQSQAQKEVTANALHDSASPSMLFARRASTTSALTWGYYGGSLNVAGTPTPIANGTLSLTASATNYVECTTAGAISVNTSAFTGGRVPLYTVVTGSASVTSYTDHRQGVLNATTAGGTVTSVNVAAAGSAGVTFSGGPITSTGTITASANIGYLEVPQNSQSANYTLVIGDSGKGIDHPSTDANARTFTIPANGSVAYPVGTCITFTNMTANVVTIAITTDTLYLAGSGTTGSRSLAQYGIATARKLTSTTWLISGTGLS